MSGNTEKQRRIDFLAEEIAVVSARIDASKHYLLTLVREFDELKGWAQQGARGPVQWLQWRIGHAEGTAREHVRVARALGELPKMDGALREGTMSYTKVRAMTRVATPELEGLLLEQARTSTGAAMERICRGVRRTKQLIEAEDPARLVRRRQTRDGMVKIEIKLFADEAEAVWQAIVATRDRLREEAESGVQTASAEAGGAESVSAEAGGAESVSADAGGAESVSAEAGGAESVSADAGGAESVSAEAGGAESVSADAGGAASVSAEAGGAASVSAEAGGAASVSAEAGEPREKPEMKRAAPEQGRPTLADAVLVMAEDAMTREPSPPRAAPDRRMLFVHLQHDQLTGEVSVETHDHRPLRIETLRKIACDCGLIAASRGDDGRVLALTTKRRTVAEPLRRALMLRDRHCVFPGCQCKLYLEAHHVKHWLDGGETSLDNLVLLCWYHHGLVHREGFRVEHAGEGVRFREPNGREIPRAPQPAPYQGDPLTDIVEAQARKGIHIGPRTALPDWDGTHQDWRAGVDALTRRAPWATKYFDVPSPDDDRPSQP